jgi:hypothetical protein
VRLDGTLGEAEFAANDFVGRPACYEAKHVELTSGKPEPLGQERMTRVLASASSPPDPRDRPLEMPRLIGRCFHGRRV